MNYLFRVMVFSITLSVQLLAKSIAIQWTDITFFVNLPDGVRLFQSTSTATC